MPERTATVTKMPVAEVIAAQTSAETPRQLAKRLGVTLGFVRGVLTGQNWAYTMFNAAMWRRPMSEIRAAVDARAEKLAR